MDKQHNQQRLVETLRSSCHPISERILQAFLTVPRHPFIDHYYVHQPGTRNWTRHEQAEGMLRGKFISPASFMILRDTTYIKRTIHLDFHAPLYASFPLDRSLFHPQLMCENPDFAFFLYYDMPDLYVFQKKDQLFYASVRHEYLPQETLSIDMFTFAM